MGNFPNKISDLFKKVVFHKVFQIIVFLQLTLHITKDSTLDPCLLLPGHKSNKMVDTSNKRENQICSNSKSRTESNKLFPFVSLTPGDISPPAPALGEARVRLRL